MANLTEVKGIFETLCAAGLRFTPDKDKAVKMVPIWARVLREIPGDVLEQTALDYIALEPNFPAPAEIREMALKVKSNNGKSRANEFRPEPERQIIYTACGASLVRFPPEVQREIDALSSLDRLMTDEELAHIDALTAPYKGAL